MQDTLELLLKIRSDGAQSLKEATDLTKTLSQTASTTASSLDKMQAAFTGQLDAMRRLSSDVLQALSAIAKATNDGRQKAEDAETRQQRAIERTIQLLERKAALSGTSGAARTSLQQQFFTEDYGKSEAGIARITAAFNKLGQAQSNLPNFATNLRQFVSNPLFAAGQAAQTFAETLGPAGLAITGVAAIATLGAIGLKRLADAAAANELAFKNLSIRTGLTINGAQQFVRASQLAGVNAYALESSVRRLSESMADGGLESRKSAEALQRLGISAYTVTGQLKPMDELLPSIFERLKAIPNIADRNTLSLQLLGRSGRELLPLIENYKKYAEAVNASGAIIDKQGIEKIETYRLEVERLSLAWEALTKGFKVGAVGTVSFLLKPLESLLLDSPSKGGALQGNNQLRVQGHNVVSLTKDQARQEDTINAVRGFISNIPFEAEQRRAIGQNDRTVAGLIAQNDPHALLKKAEEDLATALDSLKTGVLPSANADTIKKLPGLKSAVDRAKALIKGPEIDEEQARRLDESKAKQLFGEEKVTAEYLKQVDILKRAHVLTQARLNVEKQIRDNNLGLYHEELQAQQATIQRTVTRTLGGAAVGLSRLAGGREAAIAEATGRLTPDSAEGINAAFQARKKAADQEFADNAKAIAQTREEAEAIKDPIKRTEELGKIRIEQIEAAKKYAEAFYDAETRHVVELIELEKRRTDERRAADKQILETGISAQRSLIERQAQRTQSLLGNQFSGPGQEVQLAKAALAIRLQLSSQLFENEINAASYLEKADDRRVAAAHALKQLIDETGNAQLQYETQIAELQKRRSEQARQSAGQFFDAISTRGGLRTFAPEFAKNFERQVFTNTTEGFFKQAAQIGSNILPGQRDATGNLTGLGQILKGTFLSPQDEGQAALKQNNDRTNENTLATVQLSQILARIAGVSAPSIPGVAPAGGSAVSGGSTKPGLGALASIIGFGGLGASLSTSLADTFLKPTEIKIANPSTFKPSRFAHPLATIGGAVGGGVAGLGLDLLNHGSSAAGTSGLSSSLNGNISATVDLTNTIRQWAAQIGQGGSAPGSGVFSSFGGSSSGSEPTLADIPLRAAPSLFQFLSAPGSGSPTPGFMTGLSNSFKGGIPSFIDAISGKDGTYLGNGQGQAFTAASRAGTIIGTVGTIATGVEGAIGGFRQGSVRGDLGGVASIAGTAAALDPEPISKAVLGGIALASGLIKSILGDPKVARQNSINLALQQEQYLAPTTLNRTLGTNGTNLAFDKYGHPVSTGGLGINVTAPQETYFNGNYNVIPGNSTPNVGPSQAYAPTAASQPAAAAPQIHVHVSAIDSKSILDRSSDIGAAVYAELQKGGALGLRIQRMVLGS